MHEAADGRPPFLRSLEGDSWDAQEGLTKRLERRAKRPDSAERRTQMATSGTMSSAPSGLPVSSSHTTTAITATVNPMRRASIPRSLRRDKPCRSEQNCQERSDTAPPAAPLGSEKPSISRGVRVLPPPPGSLWIRESRSTERFMRSGEAAKARGPRTSPRTSKSARGTVRIGTCPRRGATTPAAALATRTGGSVRSRTRRSDGADATRPIPIPKPTATAVTRARDAGTRSSAREIPNASPRFVRRRRSGTDAAASRSPRTSGRRFALPTRSGNAGNARDSRPEG